MKMRTTAVLVAVSGLIVVSSAIGFPLPDRNTGDIVEFGRKSPSGLIANEMAAGEVEVLDPLTPPPLVMDPFHTLTGESARFAESLITQLNRLGISPAMRTAHFQGLDDVEVTVKSWLANATEVKPTEDGVVVKLMVSPQLTTGNTRVNDVVYETYLMTDDGPALISFQPDLKPKLTVY